MAKNDEVAKRQFKGVMDRRSDNDAHVESNPDEYALAFVGIFDTEKIIINAVEKAVILNPNYGDKRNEE